MTNKPMLSVELQLTEQQERDLTRFYDTCEDSQPYDVPKDRMKSLACVGLVRSLGFSRYELTDAGGAAVEKLRALLDEPPHTRQEGYGEAMEKVVAVLEDQSCGACNGCANGCKLDRESPQVEPAAPHQGEPVTKAKPVAKLHAERLTGRDGEYGVTVEDSEWFNTCRLTGGIFNLYAEQPAPVAVVMPDFEPEFEAWWESDGQYCRAGGGSYEKTFAYRAYEAALAEVARLNGVKP